EVDQELHQAGDQLIPGGARLRRRLTEDAQDLAQLPEHHRAFLNASKGAGSGSPASRCRASAKRFRAVSSSKRVPTAPPVLKSSSMHIRKASRSRATSASNSECGPSTGKGPRFAGAGRSKKLAPVILWNRSKRRWKPSRLRFSSARRSSLYSIGLR